MANEWTQKLPTKPGWCWYYGYLYHEDKPTLHILNGVRTRTRRIIWVRGGVFFYEGENGVSWYQKIDDPELPVGV